MAQLQDKGGVLPTNAVFSPVDLVSIANSGQIRGSNGEEIYAPLSNYSSYSHEVKYIFEPDIHSSVIEDDYSEITPQRRLCSWQASPSSTTVNSSCMVNSTISCAVTHISHINAGADNSSPQPYGLSFDDPCTSPLLQKLRTNQSYAIGNYLDQEFTLPPPPPPYTPRLCTWSPPIDYNNTSKMGVGSSLQNMRSYHSNDQLDSAATSGFHVNIKASASCSDHRYLHSGPIYEDLDRAGPPKLAPVSGMLAKAPGKGIIRPIAFKPVVPVVSRFMSPTSAAYQQHSPDRKTNSIDDGYGGSQQDYRMSLNHSNLSHGSGHTESDRSTSFSSDGHNQQQQQYQQQQPQQHRHLERPESYTLSTPGRMSSSHIEGFIVQTPSPSDSGVGELEAMLRERDAEINNLRETMDKNERAIFQVYEERKSGFHQDVKDLQKEFEQKLKVFQRKSFKNEQMLILQIYKLQQEKKTLRDNYEKLQAERNIAEERCKQLEDEANELKSQMDSSKRQTVIISGEMSQVRQQLVDAQNELDQKSSELLSLRSQLQKKQDELERAQCDLLVKDEDHLRKTEEIIGLRCDFNKHIFQDIGKRDNGTNSLIEISMNSTLPCRKSKDQNSIQKTSHKKSPSTGSVSSISDVDEMSRLRAELEELKVKFETEQQSWVEEKSKVIHYQKQLQLNYVQMFRKNQMLEAEVEQLSLELENRDMKLLALDGEGEESAC